MYYELMQTKEGYIFLGVAIIILILFKILDKYKADI